MARSLRKIDNPLLVAGALMAAVGGLGVGAIVASGDDRGKARTVVRERTRVVTRTTEATAPVAPALPTQSQSQARNGEQLQQQQWRPPGQKKKKGGKKRGKDDIATGGAQAPEVPDEGD